MNKIKTQILCDLKDHCSTRQPSTGLIHVDPCFWDQNIGVIDQNIKDFLRNIFKG